MSNLAHLVSTTGSEKIQDHEIMVSFDVELLFTNVPIECAIQVMLQKLDSDTDLADC